LCPFCFSQEPNSEWGEVSLPDLHMKEYPSDPNASAVILYDYGEVEFTYHMHLSFLRHVRIKILNESGFDWGTVKIGYRKKSEDNQYRQRIEDLKAHTINIDEDNNIVTAEVKSEDIFDENVNDEWHRIRFSFPQLKVGSIIEYRYRIVSDNPHDLDEWIFQHREPCRWSEFRLYLPEFYHYVQVYQGLKNFDVQEVEPFTNQTFHYEYKSDYAVDQNWGLRYSHESSKARTIYSGEFSANGHVYHWIMKDIPALRKEPYTTTIENYRARLRFQLSEIRPPSSHPIQVLKNWDFLADALWQHDDFGLQIGRHGSIEKKAKSIISGVSDRKKQIEEIYTWVSNTIQWNNEFSLLTDDDLDDVFERKSGNSAEIALILISMLRGAGIEAEPLIASTRDHGFIQPYYPIAEQFNHALAYITLDDQIFITDALHPALSLNLPPTHVLGTRALLIEKGNVNWVDITTDKAFSHSFNVTLDIENDGTVVGSVYCSDRDYSCYEHRKTLATLSDQAFLKDFILPGVADWKIDSLRIENRSAPGKPLKINVFFELPEYAMTTDDMIYLNPNLITFVDKNPFTARKREYPVEYNYGYKLSSTININLPENFTADELPQPTLISLPENMAEFRYMVRKAGNIINIRSSLIISETYYEPVMHDALRMFFEKVLEAQNNQIVLRKAIVQGTE
jgi:hypothetical protein